MADTTEEQQLPQYSIPVEGGQGQAPPCFRGGAPPCRFRGARRGSCHKRRHLGFFHRFALRFMVFFLLATLYTKRADITEGVSDFSHMLASYSPDWLLAALHHFNVLAEMPFEVSTYFGIAVYSALFSLLITFARMRMMQKRKLRFQMKWNKHAMEQEGGHRHRHHRHPHFGRHHERRDAENPYSDDVKTPRETDALVEVQ